MTDTVILIVTLVIGVWVFNALWCSYADERQERLRKEQDRELEAKSLEEGARRKERTLWSYYWQSEGEIDRIVGRKRDYYE
jgi:hypothetical protein